MRPRPKPARNHGRTSLAFEFIDTRVKQAPYVKTLADTTTAAARPITVAMIREIYRRHAPGKNVEDAIACFPGREVVLLRRAQERFGLVLE